MRALAITLILVVVTSLGFAQGEAGIPAQPESVRLEWAKPAVTSATSRSYYGWSCQSLSVGAVQMAVEAAALRFGFSVMAPAQQCASRHAEAAGTGFDPRYAPQNGKMRGAQALLQVTVNFSGLYKGQEVSFRGMGIETRQREEKARVELTGVLLDVETRQQVASATGTGLHTGKRLSVRVRNGWLDQSEPARIEEALGKAIEQTLYGLNQQVPGLFAQGPRQSPGIRVARIEGSKLTLATTNGSEILDQVSLGRKYYLLGAQVEGCSGRSRIATITIEFADKDIAEARIIELFDNPTPGNAAVSLVPFQAPSPTK